MPEEKIEEKPESDQGEDEEAKAEQTTKAMEEALKDVELPEPTLSAVILRLRMEAAMYLGEGFEGKEGKPERHPKLAKYAIDTIAVLDEKTKDNQSKEEKDLITNVLTELRLRYVQVSS